MEPIINLDSLYMNNMQIYWDDADNIVVQAGACRDSTNTYDIVLTEDQTINTALSGLNGVDAGVIAANTNYAVFAIMNPSLVAASGNPLSGVILTVADEAPSALFPVMPLGYGAQRLLGYVRTDGSANFLKFYQIGNSSERTFIYDAPIAVVSAGTETSFADVDLSAAVPELSELDFPAPIVLNYSYTPSAASHTLSIRPTGSSATPIPAATSQVTSVVMTGQYSVLAFNVAGVMEVDYKVVSTDAVTIYVQSYTIYV